MSPLRTRLSVALLSLALIALELALMRTMSLRFWHHFAHMVISVALLGFGASGTVLTLLRARVLARPTSWLFALALGFAISIPLALLAAEAVPLKVQLLAWDLRQLALAGLVELALLVPFGLSAGAIGVALMDRPERLGGHYAANLLGSGAGALVAVALMGVLSTGQLVSAAAAAALLAAAAAMPRRRLAAVGGIVLAAAELAAFAGVLRYEPRISPDKSLSVIRAMPGTRLLHRAEGPLGRLDVVANPACHYAPWLSLSYTEPEPPHVLMILDGDAVSGVYNCPRREDWRFADYTTAAVGYRAAPVGSALILGAGGGVDIGLALYRRVGRIVALEINGDVIDAMTGPLRDLGGSVYEAPGVTVLKREARGYLASAGGEGERFDLVQLPAVGGLAGAGAGLHAASESYLYTVEAFGAMLDRLSPTGVLCVTRRAWSPPRDGLRIFDTAAEALRRRGTEPNRHLAMIRSWATVSVLVSPAPLTADAAKRIRQFCRERSFDLCYLPGLSAAEANQYHQLDRAYFHEGALALLSGDRRAYLAGYLHEIAAATDDRPYFHHFFRWRALETIAAQPDLAARNFLELGYLMLLAALVQTALLAAALIVLPLAAGRRRLRAAAGKAATLGYFLLLGAGFMLLEMGFLQRLILYLSDPIYSAAVVIAAFLVFAGAGSFFSGRWASAPARVTAVAAAAVTGLSLAYLLVLDGWLGLTQGCTLPVRIAVAAGTIAPLAFAMGQMFPTALRGVASAAGELVPWAWAANGFASVGAAVAAPLLAMEMGFSGLLIVAVTCYGAAAAVGFALPAAATQVASMNARPGAREQSSKHQITNHRR